MKQHYHKLKIFGLLILLGLSSIGAYAQDRSVSGKVISLRDDSTLPGVSIIVKGTAVGTVTDVDGNYKLTLPDDVQDPVLVFSSVGLVTEEIPVDNQSQINISLAEDIQSLSEVVVIGYGTVKKADLTGAVSSIKAEEIGDLAVANVGQLIQGRAAGVEVFRDGGSPGAGTSIRIRGTTSLNNTEPLMIIDGMIGDINMVNANDIASIEILKDASATAIYGSRGANGVVIVTTKKGKTGAPRINYSTYYGVAQPGKQMDVLNANDYVDLVFDILGGEYNEATGRWSTPEGIPDFFIDHEDSARVTRTDWQDQLFKNGAVSEHNFDISGGTDQLTYRLSLGRFEQESTVKYQDFTRNTIIFSNEYRPGDRFKLGSNLMYRMQSTEGQLADFTGAVNNAPWQPIYNPAQGQVDGYSWTTSDELNNQANPLPTLEYELRNREMEDNKLQLQLYGEVKIIDGLKFRSQFQYEKAQGHQINYASRDLKGVNETKMYFRERYSQSTLQRWENFATYDKSFGIHRISLLGGVYYENHNRRRNLQVQTTDFINMNVLLPTAGRGAATIEDGAGHEAYLSYYGRVNYSLLDKYLLTVNYRADASYRFGPSNRWGFFPSVALAWKMHEENFMDGLDFISQLKPRFSYGKAGNDAIPEYRFYTNVWTGVNNNVVYPFGVGSGTLVNGATVFALESPTIRWEETTTANFGLDLGLFQNKVNLTVDYYNKFTSGILVPVPIPLSTGIVRPSIKNAADVRNKGVDFLLSYQSNAGKLNYTFSVNGGYNVNEVESLGEGEPLTGESGFNRTELGNPIASFYGYKTDGVLSTTAEAEAYNSKYGTSAEAGDLRFKDLNQDGQINDAGDRTFLGSPLPDFNYGFSASLAYAGFDFQLTLSGVRGNELFNRASIQPTSMFQTYNAYTTVLDRWKMEGDQTSVPRAVLSDPNNNRRVSDRYVEDGSFMRLRNVSLGYTLPTSLFGKYVDNVRFYISGENLITVTDYTGYDPEAGGSRKNLDRGVDFGTFPMPKMYMAGVQISF